MAPCSDIVPAFLRPREYPEAPDGGWGWVVAMAFFMVELFTYGTIKSFGIFLQDLMVEFGETNSRVSWIVSICVFVMTFFGPLSSVLTTRFGFQLVVMTGGFLIAVGTIATSFATSINQMYLTYGVIAGMGYCLTFLPTVTILSQYFLRRRSLVIAVASTGESLAMVALAPVFSILKSQIGWRHTMITIGALQSTIIINGALLREIKIKPIVFQDAGADGSSSQKVLTSQCSIQVDMEDDSNETSQATPVTLDNGQAKGSVKSGDSGVQSLNAADGDISEERTLLNKEGRSEAERTKAEIAEAGAEEKEHVGEQPGDVSLPSKRSKLLDFSILKECNFIFYCLFGLFATLGFFAPQLYIIELSVSRGVPRDRATLMLSIMAGAEIAGRFFIGWLLTRRRLMPWKVLVLLACVVMMALDLLGFTFVAEFYGLAVCCALYGFLMGALACTHIPVLAEDDVVGIERMSSAAGVYVFIQSFAGLAGPPLGGVLVDVTDNYGSAFYSCAAGLMLSALFLSLVIPAKRGFLCFRRQSKQQGDMSERTELRSQSGEDTVNHADAPQDCSEAEAKSDPSGATG